MGRPELFAPHVVRRQHAPRRSVGLVVERRKSRDRHERLGRRGRAKQLGVKRLVWAAACGLLACASRDDASNAASSNVGAASRCPSPPRTDSLLAQRQACAFQPGDRVSATLAVTTKERASIPIRHIVVVMEENRSFDYVFGGLKALQPDVDVADTTFTNLDALDASVPFFHLSSTCVALDPGHQWSAMHEQVGDGAMGGFVRSAAASVGGDGHFVMGHYEEADLPFDYFVATTFAIADRYFSSVRSGTFPNRDYLLLGTSDGVSATQFAIWPDPALTTIFDELSAANVSWGVYADDHPLQQTLDNPTKNWSALNPWSPVSKLTD